MRTRIVLDRNGGGEWDEALGYLDLSHEAPLTDEQLEAFRELGRAARVRLDDPKPRPPSAEARAETRDS